MVKSLIFLELWDKNKFKENLEDLIKYMSNLSGNEFESRLAFVVNLTMLKYVN